MLDVPRAERFTVKAHRATVSGALYAFRHETPRSQYIEYMKANEFAFHGEATADPWPHRPRSVPEVRAELWM